MPYQLPRSRPSEKRHYVFILPDTHCGSYITDTPTYSIGAWDVAMQALNALRDRLTHLVLLGDFCNFESVSHWAALRAETAFVEVDVALTNARLDEISAISAKRKAGPLRVVYLAGNHEFFAALLEAKLPALRNLINPQIRFKLAERGWVYVPERHFYRLGDLHFAHGDIPGVKSPMDMIRKRGVSTVYGHVHSHEVAHVHTLAGDYFAMSAGCLASISPPPPYARGDVSERWVHGISLAQIRSNGSFQVSFRQIYDESRVELEDGLEIIANFKAVNARWKEDLQITDTLRKQYNDRFYLPGGGQVLSEQHFGAARRNRAGELIVSPTARTRRARIVKGVS